MREPKRSNPTEPEWGAHPIVIVLLIGPLLAFLVALTVAEIARLIP